jgi:hypothetical protein
MFVHLSSFDNDLFDQLQRTCLELDLPISARKWRGH